MLTGPLLRAASRLLAISTTIGLVAPMPRASSSSIRATIAPSSILLRFFVFGLQSRRASVLLRYYLSVVQGTLNALDACLVLSDTVA